MRDGGVIVRLIATFLLAIALCGRADAADVTVGTATAHPGSRANGYLRVAAGADAAAEIPVIVINGAKPGPTLALVAGAHGTEYASIIALHKLAQLADPAALSGAASCCRCSISRRFREWCPI